VDVAGAQERVDVGFVRLRGHRVAQEDHRIDPADREPRADLQVTTHRTTEEALDVEPRLVVEKPAGGAGGDQVVPLKRRVKLARESTIAFFIRSWAISATCTGGLP
jgi:hypothetical protein